MAPRGYAGLALVGRPYDEGFDAEANEGKTLAEPSGLALGKRGLASGGLIRSRPGGRLDILTLRRRLNERGAYGDLLAGSGLGGR